MSYDRSSHDQSSESAHKKQPGIDEMRPDLRDAGIQMYGLEQLEMEIRVRGVYLVEQTIALALEDQHPAGDHDRAATAADGGNGARQKQAPKGAAPAPAAHAAPAAAPGAASSLGDVERGQTKKDIQPPIDLLSDADRLTFTSSDNAAMRHVASVYTTAQLLDLFTNMTPPFAPEWMVFYVDAGNQWSKLSAAQWRRFIGLIGAEGMEKVRANPAAFDKLIHNAPSEVVPPWDLLEAVAAKKAHPSANQIRVAVDSLSEEQKATLRGRHDILSAILPLAKAMLWPTLLQIGMTLQDEIKWLNDLHELKTLDKAKWAQLITEAPKAQQDALTADPVLWPIVEKSCDPAVLQVARQNTSSPATAAAAFDDKVQVGAMFSTLGAAGFLAVATQPGADVKANYAKINTAHQVVPTLDGLPMGSKLGDQTRANLARWFNEADEHDAATLQKMVHVRFGMTLGGSGKAGKHAATVTGTWTEAGMRQAWPVLERLPPAQVEGNSSFAYLLIDQAGGNGNADFFGKSIGGDNAVTMGATPGAGKTLGTEMASTDQEAYYRKNPDGTVMVDPATGKPVPVDMNMPTFNATLRHEIGHAVDEALNLVGPDGGVATQGFAGAWKHYSTYAAFVDAVIAASGGMRQPAWPAAKDKRYHQVLVEAVKTQQPFLTVLTAKHPDEVADPALEVGPLKVLWDPQRYTDVNNGPWYNASGVEASGRYFLQSYGNDETSLFSFTKAARDAHMVTQYQWRSPWEWFADAYQVYYAEQEKGPNAPVGALLRAHDPQTAQLISGRVDRGYSPQDMRGSTKKAPGT